MTGTMADFRKAADEVRNWGRWGDDDEVGTLNFITPEKVAEAARLVTQGKVISLGGDFSSGGPQGAFKFRQNPVHVMTVDGGDASTLVEYGPKWLRNAVAADMSAFFADNPFRFNDDIIVMPLQAATQWDAMSHVYYEDKLYNGFPADSVTSFGAFHLGIEKVDRKGITSRGVLLDVVAHRGADVFCEPGEPITPDELDEIVARQQVDIRSGDIVVVHTGWWTRFLATGDGGEAGSGLHWTCAKWLHRHEVAAVASDNLMVEDPNPANGVEGTFLPMHMLCLRDMGLMLGEYWDLGPLAADCAADGVYEFQLVAPPLKVVGAVGAPVSPIAIK
ncbi:MULTISPECIES: cyclase family protein [Mycolicibacterium]|uniref:Predicted metal-dependent hydrolase n=1 Tax=Mycolicibacterium gilvum (strain DSM 45189 / LMG 24558 / Spyr1) TaxID=278137 RepID=E6TBA3_MYCSR|nr:MULTISPECIES: cyclase family protein [Mycolicibacterium]ADT98499.1 predicted metal-dependent hydrolase [Mycolicibacterium gilvum Spyr1]MBV5244882.1 cyclase family protein [Mycolicibacterium sp. PAM1]